MSTNKTIYLHIGTSKTGTTSIQGFLFKNWRLLEKQGVLYPLFDEHKQHKKSNAPNLRPLHNFGVCDAATCTKELKTLLAECQNSQCQKILLSEEYLTSKNAFSSCVYDVLEQSKYTLKIIVYVRPMADWLTSQWYQKMKVRGLHAISLAEFVETAVSHCPRIISIIERFGKENVIVRPYEKCQWKNSNLIDDFLSLINIPTPEEFDTKFVKDNISKGRNTAELLRAISTLGIVSHSFPTQMIEMACEKDIKVLESLTDAEIFQLTEKHAPAYKKLANLYNKESLFINELPKCYEKARPVYDKITLTKEQYNILRKAIQVNRLEKEELRDTIENIQKRPYKIEYLTSINTIPYCKDTLDTKGYSSTIEEHTAFIDRLEADNQEKEVMMFKLETLLESPYNLHLSDKAINQLLPWQKRIFFCYGEKDFIVVKFLGLTFRLKKENCIVWKYYKQYFR